jgi:hypothetical protein
MTPAFDIRRREPVTSSGRIPISTVGFPLFLGDINPLNIRQQQIANCPLPAIIAAIANACPAQIRGMFGERQRVVKSWFDDEKETERFRTNRIIKIQFRGTFVEVSPVLYVNAAGTPRFASTTDGAGWVSYIEKAYVVLRGHHIYENLDFQSANPLTVHQFVTDLIGNYDKIELETIVRIIKKKEVETRQGDVLKNVNADRNSAPVFPEDLKFVDDLRDRQLERALEVMLRQTARRATIATTPVHNEIHTRLNLVGEHTLAVLSYNDKRNRVRLFDAMRGNELEIELDDFILAFDSIYQATEHQLCG